MDQYKHCILTIQDYTICRIILSLYINTNSRIFMKLFHGIMYILVYGMYHTIECSKQQPKVRPGADQSHALPDPLSFSPLDDVRGSHQSFMEITISSRNPSTQNLSSSNKFITQGAQDCDCDDDDGFHLIKREEYEGYEGTDAACQTLTTFNAQNIVTQACHAGLQLQKTAQQNLPGLQKATERAIVATMPHVAYAAQETMKAAQAISDATQVGAQAVSDMLLLNPTARIDAHLHDKSSLNHAIALNAIALSQDLQAAIDEHFKQLSDQSTTISSQIKLHRMFQIKQQLEEKRRMTFTFDRNKITTYHEKQLKTLRTLIKRELEYCQRHQAELEEDIARAHENFENKMNISRDNIAITAANTRRTCILAGQQPHRLASAENFQDLANFKAFITKVKIHSDR